MEGVTDAPMRAFLTERVGFSFCVSEFLRISRHVPPKHVYFRHVPELFNDSKTATGVNVQLQILGGDPDKMALSAAKGCAVGMRAIDINFGCPAPLVNRHDGGAALLRFPERIEKIVAAVRSAVPEDIPVSAKLRLGWDNIDDIFENAQRAEAGGASWITIHARTKVQGYAPPVFWDRIGAVRKIVRIPVVANGDIWTFDDFLRCREVTGCEHFMLGRGAVADPLLVCRIAKELNMNAQELVPLTFGSDLELWKTALHRFTALNAPFARSQTNTAKRIKQWVRISSTKQIIPWFEEIKILNTPQEIDHKLDLLLQESCIA